jgi:hypothetical protein
MIEKNWEKFTTFYFAKNAPATNNPPPGKLLLHQSENT